MGDLRKKGGYTERNVKFLTHLTEPQGKIKNMKIVEEREAWIHTHFILDSFFVTEQERRQISISFDPIKAEIKKLINDVIEDFPVRLPEQRNVVTNITVSDQETETTDANVQVPGR